jgi:hypothetical protein
VTATVGANPVAVPAPTPVATFVPLPLELYQTSMPALYREATDQVHVPDGAVVTATVFSD